MRFLFWAELGRLVSEGSVGCWVMVWMIAEDDDCRGNRVCFHRRKWGLEVLESDRGREGAYFQRQRLKNQSRVAVRHRFHAATVEIKW